MHSYKLHKQWPGPIACYVLHNLIQRENTRDRFFDDFEMQDMIIDDEGDTSKPLNNIDLFLVSVVEMNATRD